MSKLRKEFREKKKLLKNTKGITLESYRCYMEATKEEFKDFQNFLSYPVPTTIKKYYEERLPFVISWTYRDSETNSLTASGQCAFSGMDKFVWGPQKGGLDKAKRGERHKYLLWYDGDDPAFIKKVEKDYFIFDVVDISAHCYTLFRITKENSEPELSLFIYPNSIYPLTLDFNTYISHAEKLKGTHLWQEFFIDRKKCDQESLKELDNMRPYPFFTTMNKLFPEVDLSSIGIIQEKEEYEPHYIKLSRIKNYRSRFKSMFIELESKMKSCNSDIEFDTTLPTIRKAETLIGRKLPDSMLAFYTALNGFKLSWVHATAGNKIPETYRTCEVNFFPLHKIFFGFDYTDKPGDPDLFEGMLVFKDDDENMKLARECYPIADNENGTTAIRFVKGQKEPELYLFINSIPHKLSVTFEEFIERFLETRGLMLWERQIIDKETIPAGYLNLSNDFKGDMKTIFPEVDLSPYRQE